MKLIYLGVCACFLLLGNTDTSQGFKWEDEDSVGVDAEAVVKPPPRSLRQYALFSKFGFTYNGVGYGNEEVDPDSTEPESTETDANSGFDLGYGNPGGNYGTAGPPRIKQGLCRTTTGEVGVCATLSDCYPVLYTMNAYRGERNITNFPLAEELIRSSGPCSSNPKELLNNIVCCSTLYQARYSERRPTRPPVRAPNTPTPPNCGWKRIVHGEEAPPGRYPWIAALMMRGRQFCGGSLIDDYHVITAAHCIAHFSANDVNNLRIYLGAHDLYSVRDRDEGRVVVAAARVTFHRGFSHQTLLNDVAVIRLSQRVNYHSMKNITPICLTTGNPAYDRNYPGAVLAGWGKLYHQGPQPSRLQHQNLTVVPQAECRRRYGRIPPAGYLPDHNVCAFSRKGADACQGDSGGPLIRYLPLSTDSRKKKAELIGIVSWGVNCGAFPGVYVRPDHFTAWINKNRFG